MGNPKILQVLQHSLGVDKYGNGEQYRNRFVTGPGSSDFAICRECVAAGLMEDYGKCEEFGGSHIFEVTPKGIDYVATESPKAPPKPKLTRSQKRYRDWQNQDSGLSFAEWIGAR